MYWLGFALAVTLGLTRLVSEGVSASTAMAKSDRPIREGILDVEVEAFRDQAGPDQHQKRPDVDGLVKPA